MRFEKSSRIPPVRARAHAWSGAAIFLLAVAGSVGAAVSGVETERLYLSGQGPEDAQLWDFRIDGGRRAGYWTTIPVPSQWELQGFGRYRYGQNDGESAEVGRYRTRFEAPHVWRNRRVDLVFEGVMTDARVELNGELVGLHRGGFTRFSFPVGERLVFEGLNSLVVQVAEGSGRRSVNAAERNADYWTFGGIFRPVYLEARPTTGVRHLAIAAHHDGWLRVELELEGDGADVAAVARVRDEDDEVVGGLGALPQRGTGRRLLEGRLEPIQPWSAEHPVLYTLEVDVSRGGELRHRVRRRFGFRSVELRPGRGLFVNGRRTVLKGINRHSFWPTTGRALGRERNRRDVLLIKELNANAVRSSHYPPDVAFLEACDELGLYVIDELPGWHDAYAASVGRLLVAEMVRRDVNHPSIIMWANGNEGGWNRRLDGEFSRHDPQRRPVIHPGAVFGGVDAVHYPSWGELARRLSAETSASVPGRWTKPLTLVMPTEMLHGLYDGGMGAGLEEAWRLVRAAPRAAGGFLWALLDEAVVRTDRGAILDTHGNHAPDGVVGPFREREASFASVREVWWPVVPISWALAEPSAMQVRIENRFDHLALDEVRLRWRLVRWPLVADRTGTRELGRGEQRGPPVGPGGTAELLLPVTSDTDAVEVSVIGPRGSPVAEWVLPVSDLREPPVSGRRESGRSVPPGAALQELGVERIALTADQAVTENWSVHDGGWLRLQIESRSDSSRELEGVALRAGGSPVRVEWLGRGPGPVWRNRLAGPRLGLWRGRPQPGFFAGVRWARLIFGQGILYLVFEDENLYLSVSAPRFPPDARHAAAPTPPRDTFGVFLEIPAIGSKFHPAEDLVAPPSGQGRDRAGRGAVWLRWQAGGEET